MVNAKPKSVMRAAAMASVLTFGIVVPAGSAPLAGSEPARDAWKYPESASLAGFLEDIVIPPGQGERVPASAMRGPVMLDQLIHRAVLTGHRSNADLTPISLGPRPRGTVLEFGLGEEAPSGARISSLPRFDSLVPVMLSPRADAGESDSGAEPSQASRRRDLMRELAQTTSHRP